MCYYLHFLVTLNRFLIFLGFNALFCFNITISLMQPFTLKNLYRDISALFTLSSENLVLKTIN